MSTLVDNFLKEIIDEDDTLNLTQEKNGEWYIAKPLPFYSLEGFFKRFKDMYLILIGRATAIHFKEDEK